MNPSESNLAAGSGNQPLISHLQTEACENTSKNDVVNDVDHDHGTPTASNRLEKYRGSIVHNKMVLGAIFYRDRLRLRC